MPQKFKGRRLCRYCNQKCKWVASIYCSNRCQFEQQYKIFIEKWKSGLITDDSNYIRRYIFEKYDGKCSSCGWKELNLYTGKKPLEVHHKDGDFRNNIENNLDLLCPNCHSLTSNYGSRNQGYGRRKFLAAKLK